MITVIDDEIGFIAPTTVVLKNDVIANINSYLGTTYTELEELSTDTEMFVDSIMRPFASNMASFQAAFQRPYEMLKDEKQQIEHIKSPTYGAIKNNFKGLCDGINIIDNITPGIGDFYIDNIVDHTSVGEDNQLTPEAAQNKILLNDAFEMSDGFGTHHTGPEIFEYISDVDNTTHEFNYYNLLPENYTYLDIRCEFSIKKNQYAPNIKMLENLFTERMKSLCTIGQDFYHDAIISSMDFPTVSDFFVYSKLSTEQPELFDIVNRIAEHGQRYYLNSLTFIVREI